MTTRTLRPARRLRHATRPQSKYVVLPRSEYPRLRHYPKHAGYIVDALDFSAWSIGRDLRRQRRKAKLTQAEVAARAKIRVETLSRLENGHGNPTLKTVRKILSALGARTPRP
jgi:DNA-binding XRE family transcriptional regulator